MWTCLTSHNVTRLCHRRHWFRYASSIRLNILFTFIYATLLFGSCIIYDFYFQSLSFSPTSNNMAIKRSNKRVLSDLLFNIHKSTHYYFCDFNCTLSYWQIIKRWYLFWTKYSVIFFSNSLHIVVVVFSFVNTL